MSTSSVSTRLLAIGYGIASTILWGQFLLFGWNWWITDLGAPALTIGPAVGIYFVLSTLLENPSMEDLDGDMVEKVIVDMFRLAFGFAFLGLVGLVVGS